MPNKTPEADFKRFEHFIDGMEDIEFEYWYRNEASAKQKELVDGMREEVDEDEVFGGYSGETFFGLQGYRSKQ